MNRVFTEQTSEQLANGFEDLQQRFAGKIEVVEASARIPGHLDAGELKNGENAAGFVDISAKAADLGPLLGRVVLYPNIRAKAYQPAVITAKTRTVNRLPQRELQMTVLDQPYDTTVGVSSGMLFALGLKNDTNDSSFGKHTASGGLEAGHFAPAMIGAKSVNTRNDIVTNGDKGTHAVGNDVGGVPEKMIKEGLMGGITMKTYTIDERRKEPIPLFWHRTLESNEGLMIARYTGPSSPVRLMLGAANLALGPRAVDKVGELTDAAIRGA